VGGSQRVRDALRVTGVEQFLQFYETEAAARPGLDRLPQNLPAIKQHGDCQVTAFRRLTATEFCE